MITTGSFPNLTGTTARYKRFLMSAVRILIADDTAQVRSDLRTILPLAGEMNELSIEIAGEAEDGYNAIRMAGELHPDVILMDLTMPELDGFEATRKIKTLYQSMKVLILTVHSNQEARQKAAQAGADGFIEKGAPITEIIHHIQSFE